MGSSAALATKVYDLNGRVYMPEVVENASRIRDYERRMTRSATLDTGAYIDDRGYFDGDRTIEIAVQGDKTVFDSLLYILQNYSSIWIFIPDGAYAGNMKRLNQDNGRINLTLLLESEL